MKPENILIFKDYETYFVKLADFGISKAMNTNTIWSTMNIQGTIGWIAPEVSSGTKEHVRILTNFQVSINKCLIFRTNFLTSFRWAACSTS